MTLEYIEKVENIARVAHNVNRAYCESLGDFSQPLWDDAPEWQKNSAMNGVKAILEDPAISPRESHANWMKQKYDEGWEWGPEKDPENKKHPCFVEYDELPVEQVAKDYLFRQIVLELGVKDWETNKKLRENG